MEASNPTIRIRINVSTTAKGLKQPEVTVEVTSQEPDHEVMRQVVSRTIATIADIEHELKQAGYTLAGE